MQDMDMISSRDRSIRNIPLGRGHQKEAPSHHDGRDTGDEPPRKKKGGRRRGLPLLIAVIVVCVIGGVLLSTVFEKTTITLTPHETDVTPTAPITAVPTVAAGSLVYQSFSMSRTASTTSAVSSTQKVSKYATGVVTIYNTFGAAPQKLLANTRFASPDGKIYRIHTGVIVPGETKGSDGSVKAGTVTASLYADEPGESYNRTDSTRFTIPGFKGDPRYTTFYAQSQGPISGGFVGEQAVISSADLSAASKVLKQSLQASIESATGASSVPEGYLVVPGTLQVSYTDIAQTPTSAGSVSLSQSATAKVAMVRLNDLAAAVAHQMVSDYKGEAVTFKNPAVSISGGAQTSSGAVNITVAGPLTLVWQVDQNAVKSALVGKPKASFESIIKAFGPGVEKAEAKVRPFWEQSFPSDQNKIEISLVK